MKIVLVVYIVLGLAAIADGALSPGWQGLAGSLAGGVLAGSSAGRLKWGD